MNTPLVSLDYIFFIMIGSITVTLLSIFIIKIRNLRWTYSWKLMYELYQRLSYVLYLNLNHRDVEKLFVSLCKFLKSIKYKLINKE